MAAIVLSVRLLEPRYHGAGPWPPEPGRVYQALLAGAGLSGPDVVDRYTPVLRDLQSLPPPEVWAPAAFRGQPHKTYVPNNNGDNPRIEPRKMRTAKIIVPWLLLGPPTVYFLWRPAGVLASEDAVRDLALELDSLAARLYQLGRGVDFACASADYVDDKGEHDLIASLRRAGFRQYRPVALEAQNARPATRSGEHLRFRVPTNGTLESLLERHHAFGARHRFDPTVGKVLYRQPAPARFQMVTYEQAPPRRLYVLESPQQPGRMVAWPLPKVALLVEQVREAAIARLVQAEGPNDDRTHLLEQALRGARPGEARLVDTPARVRLIPLPSFGHVHADRAVRRLLVEVPAGCPLPAEDVFWAFGALPVRRGEEVLAVLRKADTSSDKHLQHFGVEGENAVQWRAVTPAVLPASGRTHSGSAAARRAHERRLAKSVRAALRHAGWEGLDILQIQCQREPFGLHEERAERFAEGTRFEAHRLWHVRMRLRTPISGPVVLGDGRFLGLGLMAPERPGIGAWQVRCAAWPEKTDPTQLARSLRRAVMARYQAEQPNAPLPAWVSGHEPDGRPADRARNGHLYFIVDPQARSLGILAPHRAERRSPRADEYRYIDTLDRALLGMHSLRLRGGQEVSVTVEPAGALPWLDGRARRWRSATPYLVTRHHKLGSAVEALQADVRGECARHGLPQPEIEVERHEARPGVGLTGWLTLSFAAAQEGPLLLGRSRHLGGGLFVPALD